ACPCLVAPGEEAWQANPRARAEKVAGSGPSVRHNGSHPALRACFFLAGFLHPSLRPRRIRHDDFMTPNDERAPAESGEERKESMGERYQLPVLPLRDTVVYPGVAVPISAGRPGTVEAVQEALEGDRRLFAVAQRENVDEPDPEVLYKVGTVVRIIQTHRVRGGVQLLVQGEGRAQAINYEKEGEHMLRAVLLEMQRQGPRAENDPAFQALDRELRDRAAELGTRREIGRASCRERV